jgi:anhydro-N-acetylmuramic acid kinase
MTHPFADLLERRPPSDEGADVGVELRHYREHPHDPEVKRRVIALAAPDVRGVAERHVMIGEAFAAAALATIAEAGLAPPDIDLIGSHGRTNRSWPTGSPRPTRAS